MSSTVRPYTHVVGWRGSTAERVRVSGDEGGTEFAVQVA